MQMKNLYQISLFLDTRRKKKNGLYPVKLRAYDTQTRKQKLFPTIFDYSEKEFKQTWISQKPLTEYKENRKKLQSLISKAEGIADNIIPFSLDKLEKRLNLKSGENQNLIFHYNELINRYDKLGRIGTKDNYKYSLKSIKDFHKFKNKSETEPTKIKFSEITKDWLEQYERFITDEKEQSKTTIGFYLRPLRAVFNKAIKENDISQEIYPFIKDNYKIPKPKRVKKALNSVQLKQLFDAIPKTPEQEKAKDFWFFSYACNGMNIKDIALIKQEDIKNDSIVYYRAKTINTSKDNLQEIVVYLNQYSKSIIEKYSYPNLSKKDYVFPILNEFDTEQEKHGKIKNFVRFVNQNLKVLAKSENLPTEISTYWARHTFSTIAIRNGASMEFISEALNHSDLKTTKNYIAGFEDDVKKEFSNNLMNF